MLARAGPPPAKSCPDEACRANKHCNYLLVLYIIMVERQDPPRIDVYCKSLQTVMCWIFAIISVKRGERGRGRLERWRGKTERDGC